jgi:two-component system, OmpR family, copper resistance phosphate regulon response regulator CusR
MNRILIAEDEPRIAAFMAKGLVKNGYAVEVASTGTEVMQMVQTSRFDLLLLDLGLPEKNGWTVLEELRQLNHSLPIIIVSAQAAPDRVIQHHQGIRDYLPKPFKFGELIEKIRTHLPESS